MIDLADGVEGYLRASELSRDRVEDARTLLKEGQEIEAKLIGVDRKNRTISLSINGEVMRPKSAEAIKGYARDAATAVPTLGDLLKEQMENQGD